MILEVFKKMRSMHENVQRLHNEWLHLGLCLVLMATLKKMYY